MIGVDIEEIERFKNKLPEFYRRIFTEGEIKYCNGFALPESHYAARFCAKEAVIKALSTKGIKIVSYKDIEVYHDENKCPKIRVLKEMPKNISFDLSLSHDKTKAVAFVVLCC